MKKFLSTLLCVILIFTFMPTMAFASDDSAVATDIPEVTEVVGVTDVVLSAPASIVIGDVCQVTAIVKPEDASDKSLVWTSSDESIATVDEQGQVTGVSAGTVTITAEAHNGLSGSCDIIVKEREVAATGISLNKTTLTLTQGNSYTLKATVKPTNATNKTVTFTSGYKTVATVSANGVVKGLKPGTATITAKTANGKTAKCKVTVKLSKPTAKVSRISTTGCKVSWNKVANASGYYVYRATSKSGKYSLIKKVTGNSTLYYKNTGLKPGKTYYYKVKAYAKSSTYNSSYSSIVSYKTVPKTPVVSSSVYVTSSTVKLSWDKVSDASGYCIYKRSSTSSSWTKIATVTSGKTTSYTYKNAKGNYYYSVKSYRTINGVKYYSDRSAAKRARVLGKTTLKSISRYSTNSMYKQTVKWSSVTGATSYQVYVKAGADGTYKRVATVKGTSYTYSTPSHGLYYYYKIRPIYQYNGTTSYGSYSNVKSYKIYHYPDYEYWVSSETEYDTNAFVVYIKNTGDRTMRVYSRNAFLEDQDYYSYDRDLYMYDYNEFNNNGRLVKTGYTDIKPGQETFILLGCDKSTWYDSTSRIWPEVRYEGQFYDVSFSDYYGSYFYSR